jgi:hypothetical protein
MQKIVVEGGRALRGAVRISGAKKAVLPIQFAGLLADDARLEMHAVLALHLDPCAGQAGFDQGTNAVCVHRGGHRGA